MKKFSIMLAAAMFCVAAFATTASAAEADRLYTAGAKYYSSGDYDNAEKMFTKALGADRGHLSSMFMMGETLSTDIRRLDDAEGWYLKARDKAERTGRDLPKVLFSLGRLYILLGRYDDSLAAFDRLLTISPDFFDIAKAYNQMGVAAFRLDRYDEALDYFKAALKTSPDMPEAVFNMKTVQGRLSIINNARYQERMGNEKEAIVYYNEAIDKYPDYVAAWYQLGILYMKDGGYDKAVRHLERAWVLNQSYLGGNEIPYRLAMAYDGRHGSGDTGRAVSLFEGLGGYRDAAIRAGVLMAELGRLDEAEKSMTSMTGEDKERLVRAEAFYQLGVLYRKAGRGPDAAASFQNALGLAPEVEKYRTPPSGE